MPLPPLTNFTDVQKFIKGVLNTNGDLPVGGPHKEFWSTLTYPQFTTGNVPGVNPAVKILVVGDSKNSNIILALQGVGPLFGPAGRYGQMPRNGTPFTNDQIDVIAAWIDKGCPEK
jgi:hypothetical protein